MSSEEKNNVAISPLAIPILAGPGTIVAAMNNVTNASLVQIGIVIVHFCFNDLSDLSSFFF